jgi:hypothetical protein
MSDQEMEVISDNEIPYFKILEINDEGSFVDVEFTVNLKPHVEGGTWIPEPIKIQKHVIVERLNDGTFDEKLILKNIKQEYRSVYKAAEKQYLQNIKNSVEQVEKKLKHKKIKLTDDDLNYVINHPEDLYIDSLYGSKDKVQGIRHIILETLIELNLIK